MIGARVKGGRAPIWHQTFGGNMSENNNGGQDRTIFGRLSLVTGAVGAVFIYLFNNWSTVEPVLMSPVGGIGWSVSSLLLGSALYHFAVHAPVLTRLAAAEEKLNRMTQERLRDVGELNLLRGKLDAMEQDSGGRLL